MPLCFTAFFAYAGLDLSWGPLHIPERLQIPIPMYVLYSWAIAPLAALIAYLVVRRWIPRVFSVLLFLVVWNVGIAALQSGVPPRMDNIGVGKWLTDSEIATLTKQLPFKFCEEGSSGGLKIYFERNDQHKSQLQSALSQMGILTDAPRPAQTRFANRGLGQSCQFNDVTMDYWL